MKETLRMQRVTEESIETIKLKSLFTKSTINQEVFVIINKEISNYFRNFFSLQKQKKHEKILQ